MLDIAMPGLDGCELARQIRRDACALAPLLVAVSGWGRPDDRQRSLAAGFDAHLVKPLELSELQQLFAAHVAARAGAAAP